MKMEIASVLYSVRKKLEWADRYAKRNDEISAAQMLGEARGLLKCLQTLSPATDCSKEHNACTKLSAEILAA